MSRIRTVKPEISRHELLFEAEKKTKLPIRFAWTMMFGICDREGRFRWRSRQLKLDVLPYDDVDFEKILNTFVEYGFIKKYTVDGEAYGCIPSWHKHQTINIREAQSCLPSDDLADAGNAGKISSNSLHVHAHGEEEGKGREEEGEDFSTAPQASPCVIDIPLIDKSDFAVTQKLIEEFAELYPAVDIMQQLKNYKGWCLANPTKRKTRRGILKSINTWLADKQDKGGGNANYQRTSGQSKMDAFTEINERRIREAERQESFIDAEFTAG